MFDGFDQEELLAYVEDGLDPARAAALRRKLAANPQAEQAVERLREDRALLRAMEAPEVPDDLMAELEPMLARPMLMPRPADWRRRYRARRRWPMAAAAACLALLVPAALWAVYAGWLRQPEPMELAHVPHETSPRPAPGPGAAEPGAPASTADPAGDAELPLQVAARTPAGAAGPAPRVPRAPGEPPKFVAAEVMLVVHSPDDAAIAESLRRSLESLGVEGALVRNFTTREAQELAMLGSRAELRLPEGVPPAALADAGEGPGRASPAAPRMPGHNAPRLPDEAAPAAPTPQSAQLWGRRELAPAYERQLEFSQRGAAFTVSIPAGRLAELLARLELAEGHRAALRVAHPHDPPENDESLRWLHDYPQARAALESLRADPDAMVFLPVVVEKGP